jgi:hypothetical protein
MLAVLLSVLLTGAYAVGTETSGDQNLLVLYSSDVIGETEPCG